VAASAAAAAVAVTKAAAARATAKMTYNLRQQARGRRGAPGRAAAAPPAKPGGAPPPPTAPAPAGDADAGRAGGAGEPGAKPGAAAAAAAAAAAGAEGAAARVRAAVLASLDEAAAGGSLAELTPEDLFPGVAFRISQDDDEDAPYRRPGAVGGAGAREPGPREGGARDAEPAPSPAAAPPDGGRRTLHRAPSIGRGQVWPAPPVADIAAGPMGSPAMRAARCAIGAPAVCVLLALYTPPAGLQGPRDYPATPDGPCAACGRRECVQEPRAGTRRQLPALRAGVWCALMPPPQLLTAQRRPRAQVHSERDLPAVVDAAIELEVGDQRAGQRAYPPMADPPLGASIMASLAASLDEGDAPKRAPEAGPLSAAEEPGFAAHGGDAAARAAAEGRLAEDGRWAWALVAAEAVAGAAASARVSLGEAWDGLAGLVRREGGDGDSEPAGGERRAGAAGAPEQAADLHSNRTGRVRPCSKGGVVRDCQSILCSLHAW